MGKLGKIIMRWQLAFSYRTWSWPRLNLQLLNLALALQGLCQPAVQLRKLGLSAYYGNCGMRSAECRVIPKVFFLDSGFWLLTSAYGRNKPIPPSVHCLNETRGSCTISQHFAELLYVTL
jgi:hypothetical protein